MIPKEAPDGVTRADREAAFRALYPLKDALYVESWLSTGDEYGLASECNRVASAIAEARGAQANLAPTYFASNHEAGDGQNKCTLCDEDAEEPHALTVCIANLRSERDALHGWLGQAEERGAQASAAEVERLRGELLEANRATAKACSERERVTREYAAFVRRQYAEPATDERLAADIELLRIMALEFSGEGEHEALAVARIEAALAVRGTR